MNVSHASRHRGGYDRIFPAASFDHPNELAAMNLVGLGGPGELVVET